MEEDPTKKEENGLAIENFINPGEVGSLQESCHSDSEDDLMRTIEPNQVNLDHITPSLFISPEEPRAAPVWTGEQEISSSTSLRPCEGPAEDVTHGFIRSQLSEESFDIPPPPSVPPTIPPLTPYLGFVPYPMYHPQQSPGIMQYPYSSTPFHTVIPYGYTQSLEMAPSHVQQLYMKRIIPQPDFISPVLGTPHLSHGISSHPPPQFNSFASISHPSAPYGNENVSSAHEGQAFRQLERNYSDLSNSNADVTLVSEYPSPPPPHSSPVYITPGMVKEDLDFKPFHEDFQQETICTETNCPDYNNGTLSETYFSEVPTVPSKFKVESTLDSKNFDGFFREKECNSSTDYDTNGYTYSSLKASHSKNKNVTSSDMDHAYPPQQDDQRTRPKRWRNCKNLFQNLSIKRSDGTQLPKGTGKMNLKTNNGAELLSCSECRYSSFSKSNFKNHLLIHSDERLFACPHCSYRGKQSAGLRAHLKVHSVEKPFQCSVCNYTSKRKQNLVQHFRIHSKYRPFFCSYCSYRSTTKQTLQKHMAKHFGSVSKKQKDKNKSRRILTRALTVTSTSASNTGLNFIGKQEREDEVSDLDKDQNDIEEKMVTSTQLSPTPSDFPGPNNSSNNKSSIYGESKNSLQLGSEFIVCLFCDYKTKEVKKLSQHILSHKLNDMKCTLCDFQCHSPSLFASHIQMHKSIGFSKASNSSLSEDTLNKCETSPICPLNDPSKLYLQCPYCDLDVQSVKYLKQHITDHTDEDFWLFERNPSNLEGEGGYEGLIQADHQTSKDSTEHTHLKNKMASQQPENNKQSYPREVVVCTSPKVIATAGKVTNNESKQNQTSKNHNIRKERTLKPTSKKYPKSFVSPPVNFSVRKNVFKYLRRIGNHKEKVIPAKNLKNIQNRMKMSSKLINERLKVQPKCRVSTSRTLKDSNVFTKIDKVVKVEQSPISESCKDESLRTTDNQIPNRSPNEIVNRNVITNEISCCEASPEESLSPDSNTWPGRCNEEILPQIVSVTSASECIEHSSVRLDDNTQTMKRFLYPRRGFRCPSPPTQVGERWYANRPAAPAQAFDRKESLNNPESSLELLEISHDFGNTYDKELENLDANLHVSTSTLTDQSTCSVKNENRESSPKNWEKTFVNQSILKHFLLGSNKLSDIHRRKAIQEEGSCLSGLQIYTETHEGGKLIDNCANIKSDNSFNLDNQQLLSERQKFDTGSNRSITTKSPSQKPNLATVGDYSLLPPDLSVGMEPKDVEPNSLSEVFKCNCCDTTFRKKSSLVSHKRSHAKDEFKCHNSSSYKRARHDHERSHSKRKVFKCTECDFASARKCSLMSHCRVHKRKISACVAISSTASPDMWRDSATENGETSTNQEDITSQTNRVEYIVPLPEGSSGKILKVD